MKQYIKKSEGFTLIEMMVVIAVVGILSAAVLAGLGPSRNKAKDARIQSGVQQARAVVEGLYDPFSGGYPANEPTTAAGYASVDADVVKLNSSGLVYSASGGSFAISATLASGGSYCVDSAGTVNNGTSSGGSCGAGGGSGCTNGATRMCSDGTTQQTCSGGIWTGTCPTVSDTKKATGEPCSAGSECQSGNCSANALGLTVCQ